jgi:hypothetical protein
MARKRTAKNRTAEVIVLTTLVAHDGAWMRTMEVAKLTSIQWRRVAFALRRLSARGVVQEEVVQYKGTHRSVEETRRYRANLGHANVVKISSWLEYWGGIRI